MTDSQETFTSRIPYKLSKALKPTFPVSAFCDKPHDVFALLGLV